MQAYAAKSWAVLKHWWHEVDLGLWNKRSSLLKPGFKLFIQARYLLTHPHPCITFLVEDGNIEELIKTTKVNGISSNNQLVLTKKTLQTDLYKLWLVYYLLNVDYSQGHMQSLNKSLSRPSHG